MPNENMTVAEARALKTQLEKELHDFVTEKIIVFETMVGVNVRDSHLMDDLIASTDANEKQKIKLANGMEIECKGCCHIGGNWIAIVL